MTTTLFTPIGPDYSGITLTTSYDDSGVLTIHNDSTVGSTITGIYFEGGGAPLLLPTLDVSFTESSFDLPGGNNIDFSTTWSFTAKPPAPKNGVKSGESISFRLGDAAPSRIGVHVQSIGADEVSASYAAAIPEPGAPVLFAFAAVLFTRRICRR